MGWSPGEVARQRVNDALERLTADLKAGNARSLTAYLDAMSRLRHYSWDNVFLIAAQRSAATRVMGHHGWHDLGRAVRKGEKGISIFAAPDRDLFRRTGARMTYVFDIAQTEGKALPESEPGDRPKVSREQFESLVAGYHIPDRTVAEGAAYVAGRALSLEARSGPHEVSVARDAADKTAIAERLAAIQEISAQILNALAPEERRAGMEASDSQAFRLDAQNFEQLHRQYSVRLVNSLAGMVRDRDRAEEIAARAFSTAWEKRDGFRGRAAASTWIEAIARNEAWRFHRQNAGRFDSLDRDNVAEPVVSDRIIEDLEKREERDRLGMALAQLPDKQQRVLTAHFLDGLSVREIAANENIPLGTVLSRIHSGKQMLREAWETCRQEPRDTEPPDGGRSR